MVYAQFCMNDASSQSISVQYSTNGTTFTTFTTINVTSSPLTNTVWPEQVIDLSSVTAINNPTALYIRFVYNTASASTSNRLDNFQVQADINTSPALNVSPSSLAFGNQASGSNSTSQSFS